MPFINNLIEPVAWLFIIFRILDYFKDLYKDTLAQSSYNIITSIHVLTKLKKTYFYYYFIIFIYYIYLFIFNILFLSKLFYLWSKEVFLKCSAEVFLFSACDNPEAAAAIY